MEIGQLVQHGDHQGRVTTKRKDGTIDIDCGHERVAPETVEAVDEVLSELPDPAPEPPAEEPPAGPLDEEPPQ